MKNRIRKRRLYASLTAVLVHTSVKRLKGMLGKRHEPVPIESMNGLLARFYSERHGGEVWSKTAPVGREFGTSESDLRKTLRSINNQMNFSKFRVCKSPAPLCTHRTSPALWDRCCR
jgi:hypothetical protein